MLKKNEKAATMIIQNLSIHYPVNQGTIKALEDITLSVEKGTFLTIIGKSGCGKSTLLQAIANLCKIDIGQITHANNKIPSIGFIFQEPRLMPWLTVKENISFGLQHLKKKNPEIIKKRIDDILQLVKLEKCDYMYPNQLSGGMKQRVSIARTLVTQPDLLLLDEPFSALDAFTKRTLQNELLSWWENTHSSVIFVTHDIEEAILLGQRVIVMDDGRITEDLLIDLKYPREIDQDEVVKMRRYLTDKLMPH
ncbi:ABC transporter ATP-binding protein [Yersinia rohdei]|uniref:ABC transporter ATP-binding protein n=1 Tax=Yersinia rohdei TaxID=29485 RepID=UPI00061C8ED0|nr:ABC transporter ATP-binding protein [Yersinia rohdei]CNE61148.1 ABC transporter ATP-binding protein [Yersinia rohdei]